MTRSNFDDVGDFHEKFGLRNVTWGDGGPDEVDPELLAFRVKFLREEFIEFQDAAGAGDLPKAFDALLDIVYVAMGTAHLYGFPWQRGWDAVHRANMLKIRAAKDGSDSKRGSGWDVVKPPGWEPPDLDSILFSTIPTQCGGCHRYLRDVTLREVITSRNDVQWVDVHCPCGRRLLSRPA